MVPEEKTLRLTCGLHMNTCTHTCTKTETGFQEITLPGLCDLEPSDFIGANPVMAVKWQS